MTNRKAIRELGFIKVEMEHRNNEYREIYKIENTVYKNKIIALDKAINVLKKEIIKTYKDDFLSKFPKAQRSENGIPYGCVKNLYGTNFPCMNDCKECWLKEYEEEKEE